MYHRFSVYISGLTSFSANSPTRIPVVVGARLSIVQRLLMFFNIVGVTVACHFRCIHGFKIITLAHFISLSKFSWNKQHTKFAHVQRICYRQRIQKAHTNPIHLSLIIRFNRIEILSTSSSSDCANAKNADFFCL